MPDLPPFRGLLETLMTRPAGLPKPPEVVLVLREAGHSQRAIAGAIGISHKTVWNDLTAGRFVG